MIEITRKQAGRASVSPQWFLTNSLGDGLFPACSRQRPISAQDEVQPGIAYTMIRIPVSLAISSVSVEIVEADSLTDSAYLHGAVCTRVRLPFVSSNDASELTLVEAWDFIFSTVTEFVYAGGGRAPPYGRPLLSTRSEIRLMCFTISTTACLYLCDYSQVQQSPRWLSQRKQCLHSGHNRKEEH